MKKTILIFIITFFLPAIGFSQAYRWVDEKGVVHFSDDVTKIPDRYRKKAEKIGAIEEKSNIGSEAESSTAKKGDGYKDQLGRGEEYWKNLVEEWRKRLKEAQEKQDHARIRYNELTEKYNESKSSVERNQIRRQRDLIKQEMDQYRGQIEEAKTKLEKKIPEEAQIYNAKKEWIQ